MWGVRMCRSADLLLILVAAGLPELLRVFRDEEVVRRRRARLLVLVLLFLRRGGAGRGVSTIAGTSGNQQAASGQRCPVLAQRTLKAMKAATAMSRRRSPPLSSLSEAWELRSKTLVFLFLPALAASCCFSDAATLTACSACSAPHRLASGVMRPRPDNKWKVCKPSECLAPPSIALHGGSWGPCAAPRASSERQPGKSTQLGLGQHLAEMNEGRAEAVDGLVEGRGDVDIGRWGLSLFHVGSCFETKPYRKLGSELGFPNSCKSRMWIGLFRTG